MKRIAAIAGAGAMLLGMAGPAFGIFWGDWGSDSQLTVNNHAYVINKTETEAETGDNETGGSHPTFSFFGGGGGGSQGGAIFTGNAGATAMVGSDVNRTVVAGCDCYDMVTINNGAFVYNKTETEAETGDNETGGGGWIMTGNAGASSMVQNFVNWTMVGN
jgi:hypothetical protein